MRSPLDASPADNWEIDDRTVVAAGESTKSAVDRPKMRTHALTVLGGRSNRVCVSRKTRFSTQGGVQKRQLVFPRRSRSGALCAMLVGLGLLISNASSPATAVLSFLLSLSTSFSLHVPTYARRDFHIDTPIGQAHGIETIPGVVRYSVKYGSASRFSPSSPATTWLPPNGNSDVTALPLACPQINMDPSGFSEDCLSMILYVPSQLSSTDHAPTLLWVHGGSFIVGSASSPDIDGSNLALATKSIVAVTQYRLGALGFMAQGQQTNLAVRDVATALLFLQRVIFSFGGSPSKITIAGQSSGATMVRALLAAPSVAPLFQSAIIQSDPMDYGFLSTNTQRLFFNYFISALGCGSTCANTASIDAILNAQMDLFQNAMNIDPSAGQGEPIRPVADGTFIASHLDSTAPFPRVNKPVLISNVRNEAGPAIFLAFPNPLPEGAFFPVVNASLGPTRTNTVVASSFYQPSSPDADARSQIEQLGTDYIFKCPSWTFARNWVHNGGSAFVGLYVLGATHPDNLQIPFCNQPGSVCHEDDIEIVFGTAPNPTAAQAALTAEMQRRYKAFLRSGNPNAPGLPIWQAATTSNIHALTLGGSGEFPAGACDPTFWGAAVQYDYQVFGI